MVAKAVKRKPEDDVSLPNIAIKKAKASSAVDEYRRDDNEHQSSRNRWLEDTLRLSSDKISEPSREVPVEEVDEVNQRGNDTNEEDQAYLDSEDRLKKQRIKQSIAIPDGLNDTCESKQSFDLKLDIYPLNAAVRLQNDLEILESEMVIRDRIPWGSLRRELCRGCKGIVDKHLQAIKRREPEKSASDELDAVSRPSLGTRGGFDYFLELPTLEELAKKQRDIETLKTLRPISQEFPLEDLEPQLCEKCDKNLRTSGKLPAKAVATAPVTSHSEQIIISSGSEGSLVHVTAEKSKRKPNVEKQPVPASGAESQPLVRLDPPHKVLLKVDPPKQVTAEKAPIPQQSVSDKPQPPAQADRPKRKGPTPKPVAPEEPQQAVQTERSKREGPAPKAVAPEEPQPLAPITPEEPQPPTQAERPKRKGPAPKAVAPEEPQPPIQVAPEKSHPPARAERPTRKAPALSAVVSQEPQHPASVAPEEPQPPAQAERPKRKGPARKAEELQPPMPVSPDEPQPPVQAERPKRQGRVSQKVAPEKLQPAVRNERPKRKEPTSKAVASEVPQPPAPGGKPKKKDLTPGPIALKEVEPIQPAASKKTGKKPSRAGKPNILDATPASLEPSTHGVNKVEDRTEEAGPIQRIMGNLPEKPRGHDYYCAICYTNLTRMGSSKKLEHLEKCGTTLEEVKVMTKAQAQAAKAAR